MVCARPTSRLTNATIHFYRVHEKENCDEGRGAAADPSTRSTRSYAHRDNIVPFLWCVVGCVWCNIICGWQLAFALPPCRCLPLCCKNLLVVDRLLRCPQWKLLRRCCDNMCCGQPAAGVSPRRSPPRCGDSMLAFSRPLRRPSGGCYRDVTPTVPCS